MLELFPADSNDSAKIREIARTCAEQHITPYVLKDDETNFFRREAFTAVGKAGLLSLIAPRNSGGQALSYHLYYTMLEELAKASLSMTVGVGVTHLTQGVLINFGSEKHREEIVPKLTSGEWLGAFSLSEPGSGSDAAGLRCQAKKVDGGYRLTGSKSWCSNGGYADVYAVMARTHEHKTRGISTFLVKKDSPGFRFGKQEKKLGLRGSGLCELIFEDCFVPTSDRIGEEGDGLKIALSQLDAGRIVIGVVGLGVTLAAFERLWKLNPHLDDGAKQHFGVHYANAVAVKAMVSHAADMKDQGLPITALASSIKLLSSDLAMRVTSDAIEHAGAPGYLRENGLERLARDAKALQIVEGTNQIQAVVLARELQRMLS